MKENFDAALAAVLKSEGGYVHHSKDPGGITNLGCTKATWEEWVGHRVDEAAMRNLKPADVAPLYRAKYWNTIRGDDLPAGVDYAVFDNAINAGPFRAAKMLQEVVGVTADGVIGPGTLAAVRKHPARDLIDLYSAARLVFLQKLNTWPTFGKGWSARVAHVREAARSQVV